MKLVFFKVDNSKNYDRDEFNLMDESEVFEKLNLLSDDEFRLYDFEHTLEAFNFEYDYNQEELDGGWWCHVITN